METFTNGERSTVTITYPAQPGVCPHCGRCQHCGQPYPQPVPMVPAPFYPVDPTYPFGGPFWYTTVTS